MFYEIWETEAGNIVDTFDSKEAALDLVRRALSEQGRDAVAKWSMATCDENGIGEVVAEGSKLADLAVAEATT